MSPLAWRPSRVRPVTIGMIAHASLQRSGGRARVLARLSGSTYLRAGDDIVWLGTAGATLHPRAILAAPAPAVDAPEIEVDAGGLAPWQPALPALGACSVATLLDGWRRLTRELTRPGAPRGFGALLGSAPLEFPLADARSAAEGLAGACARDDARAGASAALALLGLGGGLTPSGDDYVGGALFARHALAAAGAADGPGWRDAARAVVAAAPARTHPISVALLGDLAAGLGWAPLHDLVAALASGAPGAALAAGLALTGLGHTSGWDVLAGVGAGLGTLSGIAHA